MIVRELIEIIDKKNLDLVELLRRVENVLAIHERCEEWYGGKTEAICSECKAYWPCSTVSALDDEEV